MEDSENLDIDVDSLVSQLKSSNRDCRSIQKRAQEPDVVLAKEDLEDFVMNKTATLIVRVTETLESAREEVQAAPDAENIEAFAELIKASASAMEILNKIVLQNKKDKTSRELKQMDIMKNAADAEKGTAKGLTIGREALLAIMNNDPIVEAEIIKSDDSDSSETLESLSDDLSAH